MLDVVKERAKYELGEKDLPGQIKRAKTDYTYFILLTAINTGRDNLRKAMDAGIDGKPQNAPAIRHAVIVTKRG